MKRHPLASPAKSWLIRLYDINDQQKLHPISVHIPNGMVPVAGIFMATGCLFEMQALVVAAYCNLAVIFLSMPGVILTGYASWQHRYKGAKTSLFRTKRLCSGLVFLGSGLVLLFQTLYPVKADHLTAAGWALTAAYLLLLIPTIIAGFLGGRLVFGGRKKMPPATKG